MSELPRLKQELTQVTEGHDFLRDAATYFASFQPFSDRPWELVEPLVRKEDELRQAVNALQAASEKPSAE